MPTETEAKNGPGKTGTLFVLATPIGNLEDITLRAIRTLKEAALIAAEDTRHTRKLLTRYEISSRLVSYHDHNKEKRTPGLIKRLRAGHSIALVTDAGTPGVSDPGYYLVRAAVDAAIPVVPVPGPSALIAALSVSGLPTDSFVFVGFVPRKAAKRKQSLRELDEEPRTLVFFESPKRLIGLLKDILCVMGERRAVVTRELTKVHEEVLRGPLSDLIAGLEARPSLKGEVTLLVQGRDRARELEPSVLLDELRRLNLESDRTLSDNVKEIAAKHGLSKKVVYAEALKLKKRED